MHTNERNQCKRTTHCMILKHSRKDRSADRKEMNASQDLDKNKPTVSIVKTVSF